MRPGSKLQSRTPEEYGDKYQDHLLEQYKLFVGTSQQVSERRQNANNYLLTLNSSLVALFVGFLSSFGHHRWNFLINAVKSVVEGPKSLDDALKSPFWSRLLIAENRKSSNVIIFMEGKATEKPVTGLLRIIHEMEAQLPVALFRYEWHVCGKGKDKDKYVPLTHLERWIPWMFGILYVGLAAYALFAPVDRKESNMQQSQPVQSAPGSTAKH